MPETCQVRTIGERGRKRAGKRNAECARPIRRRRGRLCAAAAARPRRRREGAEVFGLGRPGARGLRAVAGWDEDALTLAVEAARGSKPVDPMRSIFASTSAPFLERSHATLLVDALALPLATRAPRSLRLAALRGLGPARRAARARRNPGRGRRAAARGGRQRDAISPTATAARRPWSRTTARRAWSAGPAFRMISSTSTPRASIPNPTPTKSASCARRRSPNVIAPTIKSALANAGLDAGRHSPRRRA